MQLEKVGELKGLKALQPKKWGLEPSSLIEVYAYGYLVEPLMKSIEIFVARQKQPQQQLSIANYLCLVI